MMKGILWVSANLVSYNLIDKCFIYQLRSKHEHPWEAVLRGTTFSLSVRAKQCMETFHNILFWLAKLPFTHDFNVSYWLKVCGLAGTILVALSGAGLLVLTGKLKKGEYLAGKR